MFSVADMPLAVYEKVIAVNLTGVFLCTQALLQHFLTRPPDYAERNSRSIVNIASLAGLRGLAGLGAYGASKHGVIGLSRAAAKEYAQSGIRINCVAPGVPQFCYSFVCRH